MGEDVFLTKQSRYTLISKVAFVKEDTNLSERDMRDIANSLASIEFHHCLLDGPGGWFTAECSAGEFKKYLALSYLMIEYQNTTFAFLVTPICYDIDV